MADREWVTRVFYAGAGLISLLLIPISVAWFTIGTRYVHSVRYNMIGSTITIDRPTLLPFITKHQVSPVSSIVSLTPIRNSKSYKLVLGEPEPTWFILKDEPACKSAIEAVRPKIKLPDE